MLYMLLRLFFLEVLSCLHRDLLVNYCVCLNLEMLVVVSRIVSRRIVVVVHSTVLVRVKPLRWVMWSRGMGVRGWWLHVMTST